MPIYIDLSTSWRRSQRGQRQDHNRLPLESQPDRVPPPRTSSLAPYPGAFDGEATCTDATRLCFAREESDLADYGRSAAVSLTAREIRQRGICRRYPADMIRSPPGCTEAFEFARVSPDAFYMSFARIASRPRATCGRAAQCAPDHAYRGGGCAPCRARGSNLTGRCQYARQSASSRVAFRKPEDRKWYRFGR